MEDKSSLNSRIVSLGISRSYASEIVSGNRSPSVPLAIRIFRELGVKLGPLVNASDEEINALESVNAKRIGRGA